MSGEEREAGAKSTIVAPSANALATRDVKAAAKAARDAGWSKPNTEYIFCSEASRVSTGQQQPGVPSMINLLVPSHVLNLTMEGHPNAKMTPPLVEVSCSAIDMYPIWPVGQGPDARAAASARLQP